MSKDTESLRIGILGTANIAPACVVVPARKISQVEVVGVASRTQSKANRFAKIYNIPITFASYDELIQSPQIDLVYIALPISEHATWALKAANAGKHVLVEKSFALNEAQAISMIEMADTKNVRIFEAFHYRYHPLFQEFLHWLESGKAGIVKYVDAEFSVAIPEVATDIRQVRDLGGGALRDLGCYPINWILNIVNELPTDVNAQCILNKFNVDELVEGSLRFPSGIRAKFRTCMKPEQKLVRRLTVTGTKDKIIFENPLAPHEGAQLYLKSHPLKKANAGNGTTYFHQLSAIKKAISSGESVPTEGKNILRQQRVLDMIYAHMT